MKLDYKKAIAWCKQCPNKGKVYVLCGGIFVLVALLFMVNSLITYTGSKNYVKMLEKKYEESVRKEIYCDKTKTYTMDAFKLLFNQKKSSLENGANLLLANFSFEKEKGYDGIKKEHGHYYAHLAVMKFLNLLQQVFAEDEFAYSIGEYGNIFVMTSKNVDKKVFFDKCIELQKIWTKIPVSLNSSVMVSDLPLYIVGAYIPNHGVDFNVLQIKFRQAKDMFQKSDRSFGVTFLGE